MIAAAPPPLADASARHHASMIELLHLDDELVVVAKASGLLVHRGWGDDEVVAMTLVRDRIGRHVFPVHRLDRATSGVLVFALTPAAARALQAQFAAGAVRKRYLALTRGVTPAEGTVDHPLARETGGAPRPAITDYRRLAVFERYSLVEARPRTGRLHQIRRHFKHLSHPLIGDVRYGKGEHNRLFRARFGLHRLALHALELAFEHPRTGETLSFRAHVPADLLEPLARMGLGELVGELHAAAPAGLVDELQAAAPTGPVEELHAAAPTGPVDEPNAAARTGLSDPARA